MIGLKSEIESLAEKGSDSVSDAADEVLLLFKTLATSMRCTACGVRYTSGLPEGNVPYVCIKCGRRALYPEDRFTLAKLYCNGCGNISFVRAFPAKPARYLSKCGGTEAKQMYACRSCGHQWGGKVLL